MSKYNYPQSDANTFYMSVEYSQQSVIDIIERAQEHFCGNITPENLLISAENIKITGCGCCYDPSDYQMYLVVTKLA